MQYVDPFLRRFQAIDIRKLTQVIAAGFFVVGTLVAYSVASGALAFSDTRYDQRVEQEVAAMRSHVKFEFAQYDQLLEAAAAFSELNNQDDMTRQLWKQYIQKSNILESHPAMLGIGYVDAGAADSLLAYQNRLRDEYGRLIAVYPKPQGAFTSISYIQPETDANKQAVGYDMHSEATRKAAMTQARDTGKAILSGPVQLVQDNDDTIMPGVLLYYPLYRPGADIETTQERIAALQGYVYIVVRPSDVAKQIDQDTVSSDASFAIRDSAKLLYMSHDTPDAAKSKQFSLDLYGRTWLFSAYIDKNTFNYWLAPIAILLGGIVASGLFSILVYRILTRRINYLEREHDETLAATKNELVMLASHQLRTPASGVKQYLGMLVEGMLGPMDSMQESIVKKAYYANERQIETIDQILHVAKADAGQLALQKEEVNLPVLLRELIDESVDDAMRKNIDIKVKAPPELVTWCDKRFITMAVENLISNAIKYSYTNGTVRITLKPNGKYAELSVYDKGVGIPEEEAETVFDKFVRIDNPLSVQEGGTGLGLFLAKEIARAHKGSLRVAPNGKKGSVFTLRIPIKRVPKRKNK